jgi:hypothetical protein
VVLLPPLLPAPIPMPLPSHRLFHLAKTVLSLEF